MAGKIKEFQKAILDDNDWKETIMQGAEHACRLSSHSLSICAFFDMVVHRKWTVVEVHQSWCGPCECIKPTLYRVSLDKDSIKFCTAASDKVCNKFSNRKMMALTSFLRYKL
jgi:hypothetical protein